MCLRRVENCLLKRMVSVLVRRCSLVLILSFWVPWINSSFSRREKNYPHQATELDVEIDRLRDRLYAMPEKGSMASSVRTLESWIQLGSLLQNKDLQQNTGGGVLQVEAIAAFTQVISVVDDALRTQEKGRKSDTNLEVLFNQKIRSHHARGMILRAMGKPAQAVQDHETVLELVDEDSIGIRALSLYNKGSALMMQRDDANSSMALAIEVFEEALELTPDAVDVYAVVVECHRSLKRLDKAGWMALIQRMLGVAQRIETSLALEHKRGEVVANLYFALYEAADTVKSTEEAFRYLDKARALAWKRRGNPASLEAMRTTHAQLKDIFKESFLQSMRFESAISTGGPLFIVGMMRSGSTLLETLLDLHPQAQAIGEYSVFNANLNTLRNELVSALKGTAKESGKESKIYPAQLRS